MKLMLTIAAVVGGATVAMVGTWAVMWVWNLFLHTAFGFDLITMRGAFITFCFLAAVVAMLVAKPAFNKGGQL